MPKQIWHLSVIYSDPYMLEIFSKTFCLNILTQKPAFLLLEGS